MPAMSGFIFRIAVFFNDIFPIYIYIGCFHLEKNIEATKKKLQKFMLFSRQHTHFAGTNSAFCLGLEIVTFSVRHNLALRD